jgi:hypothetical protein
VIDYSELARQADEHAAAELERAAAAKERLDVLEASLPPWIEGLTLAQQVRFDEAWRRRHPL